MSERITTRDRLRYSFLALPLAFAGIPLYIHAPDFYAAQLGLPLASLGAVLLLLRVIDALQDPIIGRLSDLHAARRLPILVSAAIMLAAGFALLFHPPQATAHPLIWFALSMLLATSAYSVLSVNLNSIGGLWSKHSHTQTRITSWREGFGLLGLLIAAGLPSILQNHMSYANAFSVASGILTLLLAGAFLLFIPWYRREKHRFDGHAHPKQTSHFISLLKALPSESRRFFAIYGLSMLASSIPAVLILFFVRDRLQAESWAGAFLAIYFLAGAGAMPLWQIISKHRNKAKAWLIAMILALVSFIWTLFLREGDVIAFGIICLLSGMAFGAELSLPPALLAGLIQKHQQSAHASLQFSLLTFLLKTAAAIAAALMFGLLDSAGLQTGQGNSEQTLLYLSLAYALLPCLIKAIAAGMLYRSLSHYFQGDNHHETHQPHRSPSHVS